MVKRYISAGGILLAAFLAYGGFVLRAPQTVEKVTSQISTLTLYEQRKALVMGISDYEKWPKLPNATEDAKEVAASLEKMGFAVTLVLNPNSREMETVLTDLVYDLGSQKDCALLFYYAGHGETEIMADRTTLGYIIPTDCPFLKEDPKGFATHAISMKEIESISLRIKARHVLMLFDSCFSGSIFTLVRAVPEDISEKSTLPVRQYITAGKEDESVPDKSMFKRCLLLALQGDADLTGDGFITGTELGIYLSEKVVNYTHRQQHPQYGKINNPDLDRGDFIFVSQSRAATDQGTSTRQKAEPSDAGENVQASGQKDQREAQDQRPKSNQTLSPEIVKINLLKEAKLKIVVFPYAKVYLDGKYIGEFPPVQTLDIVEGKHTLEYIHKDKFSLDFEIKAGEELEIRTNLQKGESKIIKLSSQG